MYIFGWLNRRKKKTKVTLKKHGLNDFQTVTMCN